jgi:hypothetical protein
MPIHHWTQLLEVGIRLLIIDLFPAGQRDPQGIRKCPRSSLSLSTKGASERHDVTVSRLIELEVLRVRRT